MSLGAWEQQALDSIEDGLAGSDPELATLMTTFTELASSEEMPVRDNIRARSRPATMRSRRKRRRRIRDQAGQAHPGLRVRYALLLWLVPTAALIAVALSLSGGSSQVSCAGSWPTFCAHPVPVSSSPPAPHGVVSHVHG